MYEQARWNARLQAATCHRVLFPEKENFFGKPTTLVPQAWSDDGSALWFSADIGRPYAFAKLTVGTGNIDTYALDKDFTATDTALNANTGKMAFSDAKASNNNQKVTLDTGFDDE